MRAIIFCFSLFIVSGCFSQDIKTFYDTRVVNGHSVETNKEGVLKFIIGHRFGAISSGGSELWGLDQSTIRLGLDYGLSDALTIGVGRSSFQKTYDGYLKLKLLKQTDDSPLSLVLFGSTAYRSKQFDNAFITEQLNVAHRMTHIAQLLVAKKISGRLSVQLMPTYLYRNLKGTERESNGVTSLGAAARYKLFKRLTVSAEYYFTPDDQVQVAAKNSLALGFNIETKGHVFQLHLGNSTGMIEQYFITETTGDWLEGDMRIGFNITRDFKIKGN